MHRYLDGVSAEDFPLQTLIQNAVPVTVAELEIDGNDVVALGFSGMAVKRKLYAALKAVIAGKCENEKEALCAYLKQ